MILMLLATTNKYTRPTMCGRFTLTAAERAVAARFGVTVPRGYFGSVATYNIAPTQSVVVVGDDGKRYLTQMRWGLVPSWAKDPSIGNRMINARAETLTVNPAVRVAIRKRRCLIVADGFYEWKKEGTQKQPVRIVLKSREPFGFAGRWEHWTSPEGEEILTCTVITTGANELFKAVHDRMPVILTRDAETAWFDPKIQEPEKLLPLLQQYPEDQMEYNLVSRQVGSPTVDKPSNIEPIETDQRHEER